MKGNARVGGHWEEQMHSVEPGKRAATAGVGSLRSAIIHDMRRGTPSQGGGGSKVCRGYAVITTLLSRKIATSL